MDRVLIGYKKNTRDSEYIRLFRGTMIMVKYNKRFKSYCPNFQMKYYHQNIINQYTICTDSRLLLKRFHIWRIMKTNWEVLLCGDCNKGDGNKYYLDNSDECDWCGNIIWIIGVKYPIKEFSKNIANILRD